MKKVGIIGLGNMGYPIYKAIESDFSVLCYDPYSKRNDIKFESDFSSLNDSCDRLILCVKPDKIVDTLKQIKEPKKIFSNGRKLEFLFFNYIHTPLARSSKFFSFLCIQNI